MVAGQKLATTASIVEHDKMSGAQEEEPMKQRPSRAFDWTSEE